MNIRKFLKTKDNNKNEIYANSIRRGIASAIDITIVLFLRAITIEIFGVFFLEKALVNFNKEFTEKFGTEIVKKTPQHIQFIMHNKIFYYVIFLYALLVIIGMVYHAYLNSSSWQATIGKRLTKIMIVRNDSSPISFSRGLAHYCLSILPFLFVLYLISFQTFHELSIYKAITATQLNVFLSISFVLWVQIHFFTKRKVTAYDLICDTVLVNGKTQNKWPLPR